MVFCGVDPNRRQSRELEKKITAWMKDYKKAIKILLLGAGESGKTTIIKQMKILHISGFSPEEKREKAQDIRNNIMEGITTLTRNLDELNIELEQEENQEAKDYILSIDPENFNFPEEFYVYTMQLWSDAGIQEVYSQQHRFQLIDCAKYFLDKVDVVKQPDYEPTIQVFDGIQAVLFLVSTSCFDLVIREDEETNRLQESINIFRSMWNSRFLKYSGFIVFLNKQDILKEKVTHGRTRIAEYFPEYNNYKLLSKDRDSQENEEYLRARCFIRDKFIDISKQVVKREGRRLAPGLQPQDDWPARECYCHFTTATDTNNVRIVFEDVHNMIIMWNLSEIGVNVS
ncbi:hypothetical protein OTU49_010167 [Cherax quadricarinatus]|uniref:Adenylate cyclase-stimulating G alpha protein n=1 Tax=Cherax quadricarinatus TaxID=27406 RepID=A0AAW0WGU4_CHEQU